MMVGRAVPVIIVRGIVRVAQSKCHNKRLLTWEVPGLHLNVPAGKDLGSLERFPPTEYQGWPGQGANHLCFEKWCLVGC